MANRVVSSDTWNDKKWASISNIRTRYVWLYLLTCPTSNSCGVFKLPLKYASADTLLSVDELKRSIRELQDLHLLIYDIANEEIAILKYPIYNLRHINDSLCYLVANGLKQAKNINLIKAVYLTLCKIKDDVKRNSFEPIIKVYEERLKGKENTIGKENPLRNNKVKEKGLGFRKVKNDKESIFLNTKENETEDLDKETWDSLLTELGEDNETNN